jgi:hypothetical protein
MLKVFISYASEDYPVARRLYTALQRRGIDPWLDDELRPGGEWNDDITSEIAASTHFVALISAHSLRDDRFVRREWYLALAQNKPFIPGRLEECALPDVLRSKQWEDLFPEDSGIVRLLRFFHREKRRGVFEETFSCNGTDNPDWVLRGGSSTPSTIPARRASRCMAAPSCPRARFCLRPQPGPPRSRLRPRAARRFPTTGASSSRRSSARRVSRSRSMTNSSTNRAGRWIRMGGKRCG